VAAEAGFEQANSRNGPVRIFFRHSPNMLAATKLTPAVFSKKKNSRGPHRQPKAAAGG